MHGAAYAPPCLQIALQAPSTITKRVKFRESSSQNHERNVENRGVAHREWGGGGLSPGRAALMRRSCVNTYRWLGWHTPAYILGIMRYTLLCNQLCNQAENVRQANETGGGNQNWKPEADSGAGRPQRYGANLTGSTGQ